MNQFKSYLSHPASLAVAAMLVLAVSGCDPDKLLTVEDPSVATPESLQDPSALPVLRAGALSDFQVAYSGPGDDGQVSLSALFTDELFNAETFPTRQEVDQRLNIQETNGTLEGLFRNLQRARASAERASEAYASLNGNAREHAEVLSLAGFTYILAGENYCSGVPFSRLTDAGTTEYGQPLPRDSIFQRALAAFTQAAAKVTDTLPVSVRIANLAKVGRGRALLNLGRYADASAAVQGVPADFRYDIESSDNSGRQQNGLFALVDLGRRYTMSDAEGGNGLDFLSARDPRAPYIRLSGTAGVGFAAEIPLFRQRKYASRSAATPLANGVEAKLIIAEALLKAGDATFIDTLNALRASTSLMADPSFGTPLAPLVDPGTPTAREDLLFRERAFWLFLTSHRMGDLRRLVRQYGRAQASVYPTGGWRASFLSAGVVSRSGSYGTDVNFPIPFDERNNPNFKGCLDRNA